MAAGSFKQLSLAIVDDDEDILRLFNLFFKDELKTEKIKIYPFTNGPDCLAQIQRDNLQLDMVFSDIGMPEMDGFELLDRMKVTHPDIDFFFISISSDEDIKAKADLLGVKGYLLKPLNFKAIRSILSLYAS